MTYGCLTERMSSAEVVESLRGKVLEKEEKEDGQQWTPYNANMSMQGIKVRGGISILTGHCLDSPNPLPNGHGGNFFRRQKQCINANQRIKNNS